ncbi:hypothetical protein [Methanobrevibacter cuticularis]|nr:hypothetical protein [Methanobrevibacter cuticularis]
MKKRLNKDHSLAKKIGYTPKYFTEDSEIYLENDNRIYINYIESRRKGKNYFKNLLNAAHNERLKIFIPQASVTLKKIIRSYNLSFDLWVAADEKLCLDNFADIHLKWLEIKHEDE